MLYDIATCKINNTNTNIQREKFKNDGIQRQPELLYILEELIDLEKNVMATKIFRQRTELLHLQLAGWSILEMQHLRGEKSRLSISKIGGSIILVL